MGLRRDHELNPPFSTTNSKISEVAVMTRRRSSVVSHVGREFEMGCGLCRVACGCTPFVRVLREGAFDGLKDRTTGADGSFGIVEAEGLRVQC